MKIISCGGQNLLEALCPVCGLPICEEFDHHNLVSFANGHVGRLGMGDIIYHCGSEQVKVNLVEKENIALAYRP